MGEMKASRDINRRVVIAAEIIGKYDSADKQGSLVQLLADLRHYCDREQLSYAALDKSAQQLYRLERKEARKGAQP